MHISSAAENGFIYTLLDDRYHHAVWMGLHDTDTEEKFIWTSGIEEAFKSIIMIQVNFTVLNINFDFINVWLEF